MKYFCYKEVNLECSLVPSEIQNYDNFQNPSQDV